MLYLNFKKPSRERLIQMEKKFGKNTQFALNKKNEETKYFPIDQVDTVLKLQEDGWEVLVANADKEVFYNPSLSDEQNITLKMLHDNPNITA